MNHAANAVFVVAKREMSKEEGEGGGEYAAKKIKLSSEATKLTDEEEQIYDRQIRLWGLAAQQRLNQAKLLLVSFSGMNIEVAKNIVLAGIGHVVVQDDRTVTEAMASSHMFLRKGVDVGRNVAESCCEGLRDMNPMIKVTANASPLASLTDEYLGSFDVVSVHEAGCADKTRLAHINNVCRAHGKSFFCGSSRGLYAYFFEDLGDGYKCQTLLSKKEQSDPDVYQDKVERFVPLHAALQTPLAVLQKERVHKLWLALIIVDRFNNNNGGNGSSSSGKEELVKFAAEYVASEKGDASKLIDEDLLAHLLAVCHPPTCLLFTVVCGFDVHSHRRHNGKEASTASQPSMRSWAASWLRRL